MQSIFYSSTLFHALLIISSGTESSNLSSLPSHQNLTQQTFIKTNPLHDEQIDPNIKPKKKLSFKKYLLLFPHKENIFINWSYNQIAKLHYLTSLEGYGTKRSGLIKFFEYYFSSKRKWQLYNYCMDYNNSPNLESKEDLLEKTSIKFWHKETGNICKIFLYDYTGLTNHNKMITPDFILRHFPNTFKDKILDIFTLLYEPNHLVFLKITINERLFHVNIYDPSFWNKIVTILPIADSVRNYFLKISNELGYELIYNYINLNHQIFNMSDCGRFSTLYLLYNLELDLDPITLNPQNIYYGLNFLKENNYEEFQNSPKHIISKVMDYTIRLIPNYFLRTQNPP